MSESDSCSVPLEQKKKRAQSVQSMSQENEEERAVTEAFVHYLAKCPQAMDTEEGIAEWWLMRHQAKVAAEMVRKVLKQLTENGRIEQLGTGQHTRYRLKP
jgi:predicted HTH transcriptional regulator